MLSLVCLFACIPGSTSGVVPPATTPPPPSTSTSTTPPSDADNDGFSVADGDCDDGDPNISPTATDIVGDDVDQNCDGIDGTDADGDGYASEASGGDDCDDTDAKVNPGAPDELDCVPDVEEVPFFGDVTFTSEASMETFCQTYNTVLGNVTVRGRDVADVEGLSCLIRVEGDLQIQTGTSVEEASFPVLEEVGGELSVDGDSLVVVDLPELDEVGGWVSLHLDHFTEGHELSLPELQTVGVNLTVVAHHAAELQLPALRSVGTYVDLQLSQMTTLSAPSLESTGHLLIRNAPLDSIDLDALHTVDDFVLANTDVVDLDGIPNLRTVAGELVLSGNEALSDIHSLLGITSFGTYLYVCGNPALSAKQIKTLSGLAVADGLTNIDICEL